MTRHGRGPGCGGERARRRRLQLLDEKGVPTQSEVRGQLGGPLAEVFFASLTGVSREMMGLEPELKGAEPPLWASPSDVLLGNVCLHPPLTSRHMRATEHQVILELGDQIVRKFQNELLAEVLNAISEVQKQMKWQCKDEMNKLEIAIRKEEREACEQSKNKIIKEIADKLEEEQFNKAKAAMAEAAAQIQRERQQVQELMDDKLLFELQLKEEDERQRCDEEKAKALENQRNKFAKILEEERRQAATMLACVKAEAALAAERLKRRLESEARADVAIAIVRERRGASDEAETKHPAKAIPDIAEVGSFAEADDDPAARAEQAEEDLEAAERVLYHVLQEFHRFAAFTQRTEPAQGDALLSIQRIMALEAILCRRPDERAEGKEPTISPDVSERRPSSIERLKRAAEMAQKIMKDVLDAAMTMPERAAQSALNDALLAAMTASGRDVAAGALRPSLAEAASPTTSEPIARDALQKALSMAQQTPGEAAAAAAVALNAAMDGPGQAATAAAAALKQALEAPEDAATAAAAALKQALEARDEAATAAAAMLEEALEPQKAAAESAVGDMLREVLGLPALDAKGTKGALMEPMSSVHSEAASIVQDWLKDLFAKALPSAKPVGTVKPKPKPEEEKPCSPEPIILRCHSESSVERMLHAALPAAEAAAIAAVGAPPPRGRPYSPSLDMEAELASALAATIVPGMGAEVVDAMDALERKFIKAREATMRLGPGSELRLRLDELERLRSTFFMEDVKRMLGERMARAKQEEEAAAPGTAAAAALEDAVDAAAAAMKAMEAMGAPADAALAAAAAVRAAKQKALDAKGSQADEAVAAVAAALTALTAAKDKAMDETGEPAERAAKEKAPDEDEEEWKERRRQRREERRARRQRHKEEKHLDRERRRQEKAQRRYESGEEDYETSSVSDTTSSSKLSSSTSSMGSRSSSSTSSSLYKPTSDPEEKERRRRLRHKRRQQKLQRRREHKMRKLERDYERQQRASSSSSVGSTTSISLSSVHLSDITVSSGSISDVSLPDDLYADISDPELAKQMRETERQRRKRAKKEKRQKEKFEELKKKRKRKKQRSREKSMGRRGRGRQRSDASLPGEEDSDDYEYYFDASGRRHRRRRRRRHGSRKRRRSTKRGRKKKRGKMTLEDIDQELGEISSSDESFEGDEDLLAVERRRRRRRRRRERRKRLLKSKERLERKLRDKIRMVSTKDPMWQTLKQPKPLPDKPYLLDSDSKLPEGKHAYWRPDSDLKGADQAAMAAAAAARLKDPKWFGAEWADPSKLAGRPAGRPGGRPGDGDAEPVDIGAGLPGMGRRIFPGLRPAAQVVDKDGLPTSVTSVPHGVLAAKLGPRERWRCRQSDLCAIDRLLARGAIGSPADYWKMITDSGTDIQKVGRVGPSVSVATLSEQELLGMLDPCGHRISSPPPPPPPPPSPSTLLSTTSVSWKSGGPRRGERRGSNLKKTILVKRPSDSCAPAQKGRQGQRTGALKQPISDSKVGNLHGDTGLGRKSSNFTRNSTRKYVMLTSTMTPERVRVSSRRIPACETKQTKTMEGAALRERMANVEQASRARVRSLLGGLRRHPSLHRVLTN